MIGIEQKAIDLFLKIRYDDMQTYVCKKEDAYEKDKSDFNGSVDDFSSCWLRYW